MYSLILVTCTLVLYDEVHGKEKLPRFVVEEGVKPAIFGSYSYNPLTQTFEVRDTESSKSNVLQIQIFNRTATQTHISTSSELPQRMFRKHVTGSVPKSSKVFSWRPGILRTRLNKTKIFNPNSNRNASSVFIKNKSLIKKNSII